MIEGNVRGIRSKMFVQGDNSKYSSPRIKRNLDQILQLSSFFGFDLFEIQELSKHSGLTFMIEGVGREYIRDFHTGVSITYQTDFTDLFAKYEKEVENILFPSRKFAERYECLSEKNLYLGSPKYDNCMPYMSDGRSQREIICKKYGIDHREKFALVAFPRLRDISKIDMGSVYLALRELGYKIIVKTRGKDPVSQENLRGDYYFEDFTWFPHTAMELISISDFIVNFDSTIIKESTVLRKKMVNFHIKPFTPKLDFLYGHSFCRSLQPGIESKKIKSEISDLLSLDLESTFDTAIDSHLFNPVGVCKNILNHFGV